MALLACPAVFPPLAFWLPCTVAPVNLLPKLEHPVKHKTVQHFNEPRHCHELTFSCYRGLPLLSDEHWLELFSAAIDRANAAHGYQPVERSPEGKGSLSFSSKEQQESMRPLRSAFLFATYCMNGFA